MFTVVAVSLALGIARNLLFTAPCGAKCLDLPWYAFYPAMFKSVGVFLLVASIGRGLLSIFEIKSWIDLVLFSGIFVILCLSINTLAVFDRSERAALLQKIKYKN